MKIVPHSDIAISGQHCAAGVPVEVHETTGREMVAHGWAVKHVAEAAPVVSEPDPIETAAIDPDVENAAVTPKKKKK